jgi:hypothetical protein
MRPLQKTFTLLFCLSVFTGTGLYPSMMTDPASPYRNQASPPGLNISSHLASAQNPSGSNSEVRFRVFPNPATDFIRIEWQAGLAIELHAELYDLRGTRVSQVTAEESDNHIRIDIQSLQRSAYLLKLFTPDGKFSKTYRIVKH